MTQYKDKASRQIKNINVGLLDYPVLQAADILLYHPDFVPVGQDQLQHLELTNTIVRLFNNKFGDYFKPIKPLLTPIPKVMSLVEPKKKMSKSSGPKHYIAITDEPEIIKEKLMKAVTGTGLEDTLPLGGQNLISLLQEFGAEKEITCFENQVKIKNIKYGELKQAVAEAISDYFADFREKRKKLLNKPAVLEKILAKGAKQAQKVAQKTLNEVKRLVGVA